VLVQERKKTAKKYEIEERRRQVASLVTQSYNEMEIAEKLGVDNSTISKDIKALKLISQQFIYDIAKSDYSYYYKQCLDTTKLILRKQFEIIEKKDITPQDIAKAKILSDMLNTVDKINAYYEVGPSKHCSPELKICRERDFGVRPGTRERRYEEPTSEEFEAERREEEEEERREAFELLDDEMHDKEKELKLALDLRDARHKKEAELRKKFKLQNLSTDLIPPN
jgi:IS30 family transposase